MFPVDFWHGDRVGAFRLHGVPDVLLPSFRDFVAWGQACASPVQLVPVGRRLRFRQVGRHWWGRLFTAPMRALMAGLDHLTRRGRTSLPSRLSPFLVVRFAGGPAARRATPTPPKPGGGADAYRASASGVSSR